MFSEWLADESSLSYCTQQLLLSWQRRTCAHSMTLIYNTPILHTLFHTLSTVWCYSKQLSKRTGSVSSQGFGEFFLAIVADSSSGVIAIELNRNATGFLHFHAPVLSDERERELLNTTSLTATRLVNTKKKSLVVGFIVRITFLLCEKVGGSAPHWVLDVWLARLWLISLEEDCYSCV